MRIWLDPDKLDQLQPDRRPTCIDRHPGAERPGLRRPARRHCRPSPGQQLNATDHRPVPPADARAVRRRSSCATTPDGSHVRPARRRARRARRRELRRRSPRYNGQPAAGIAIQLAPGANALDTAEAVKARDRRAVADLPAGREGRLSRSTPRPSCSISIEEVVKTLIEAIVLVFLVMFLFLQNWRATLIPTIAVPVVLLGTFGVLAAARLLDQHADHVRPGAGHRPAGRRRHRRGRERRARDGRGGPVAQGGDAQVDGPDHRRAGRHRAGAGRGVRADGLLRRLARA